MIKTWNNVRENIYLKDQLFLFFRAHKIFLGRCQFRNKGEGASASFSEAI